MCAHTHTNAPHAKSQKPRIKLKARTPWKPGGGALTYYLYCFFLFIYNHHSLSFKSKKTILNENHAAATPGPLPALALQCSALGLPAAWPPPGAADGGWKQADGRAF